MNKTILQIPMDKNLKSTAEKAATKQGFSSLQELVRVFLAQIALEKIEITMEKSVNLSSRNEKRYIKMTRDFQSGKNISPAKDIKDLVSQLNDN